MTSIEDELALFESEISSLVADPPAAPSKPSTSANVVVQSKPNLSEVTAPAQATIVAPPVPAVMKPPGFHAPPMPFLPHQLRPMGMGVRAPPLPPPMFVNPLAGPIPNIFVPHQLRMPSMAPVPRPSATFESAPAIYKDEASSEAQSSAPQVVALAADVLAMESKRQAELNGKASGSTAGAGGGKADKQQKPKKYIRSGGGQVWEDTSLAEWDPNDYRIFCGDLGNEVSDELLAKAFRKYPSFQKAKVVRDGRSNKSKGYGFVSFKDAEDYARAMREMDGKYVGNRPIKLRKSNWKDRQLDVIKRKQKQKEKLGLWS